ncbi:response regulator transcription factor [Natranaerovirga pectinivora]|uniref:response regulator transcription factor n=1 Tax=Natranaerovirga pectinivora TaxID=682400 RepID=UPI00140466FA|nr:response regulator transcription factor [Natranaerovirga pectinivora]
MAKEKILLVEDSPDIIEIVSLYLANVGYCISTARSYSEALQMVKSESYDLIILDILLPDATGYDLCKKIREFMYCPIIFMSCLELEENVIKALELGGDDYIVKPVRPKEIIARVRANLRRAKQYTHSNESLGKLVQFNDLILNTEEYTLSNSKKTIHITPLEFNILVYLLKFKGQKVSYTTLYENVWKTEAFDDCRTVKVHVSNLKNKIRLIGSDKDPIVNIRGEGYLLKE